MKKINILKTIAVLALSVMAAGCVEEQFQEITEITLSRCLEPQNLSAQVDVTTGDNVTFKWDVNKDADAYNLVIYTDEAMTAKEKDLEVLPSEVPYKIRLTADQKYYFKVRAYKLQDVDGVAAPVESSYSNWATYDGHATTYAVKDNLFMEVTGRTATSVSLAWSKEVSDYKEVTHITATPVKGGSAVKLNLTDAQATAAAATVEGLEASTEYQIVLFYLSASRGAVDAWTMAAPGTLTEVSTSEALVAAVNAGGEIYLKLSGSPYALGGAKPTASIKIVGEIGADGSKPVVNGSFDVSSICASGTSIICENVVFDDQAAHNHLVNFSGGACTLGDVKFINCGITNFKAGLFYNNKSGEGDKLTVGDIVFDSCDIYDMAAAMAGDCVDFRKNTHSTVKSIQLVNNTVWDGIRSFFRLGDQAGEDLTITNGVKFENNTIKNVSTVDNTNNRGIFAVRVAVDMSLKNNLFLYVDGGKTAEDVEDYAQLFQNKGETVIPTLNAADNYAYACGKDFFKKADAATTGFTVLTEDPCYNSKGNFFQLSNQTLISKKVGASKWWISYVEKEEDLTQNAIAGAHTWNLQDATLFAGEVKNSRVRDELLLVGTEATPLSADGGINFLGASELTKKGVPTEGYVSFKVTGPGSVDLEVANGGASSVVVALQDDNGFAVKGGAMTGSGVQKVVLSSVSGEGTVYLYSTGAISLKKLAWSLDVLAGNRVLATPKPAVEPVTLTEGDETAVTVTWDAVPNAASYVVVFNKKSYPAQTELSFTVAAADIAAMKPGLYNFSVQAFPREDDIYYTKSEQGVASVAIQPKSSGEAQTEVTLTWNFSDADWVAAFEANFTAINSNQNVSFSLNGLDVVDGGGSLKYNKVGDLYFIQTGGAGSAVKRAFQFDAPASGTLKVWATNTGDSEALDRTVAVAVDGTELDAQAAGYAKKDGPHELEFAVTAGGRVAVYGPVNGLCFYKMEFTYMTGAPATVEYDWNFTDADWVAAFEANFTAINSNQNVSFSLNGLDVVDGGASLKYNKVGDIYFIQTGGAGSAVKRAFQFDAPAAGTVKVWATNTGDSEALDRTVAVAVDGTEVDAKPAGYAKKDGPHELEFAITAGGRVAVYGPVNGLCFYHIYYTNQ